MKYELPIKQLGI